MAGKTPQRVWQLRLAPDEDDLATKLAKKRRVSKNDVIRQSFSLLARILEVTDSGGQLFIERRGKRQAFEIWLL